MIQVTITPLQRTVGFYVSEKTYDLLEFEEQIILDLMIEGYQNTDIAMLMGITPSSLKRMLERVRIKLAQSELQHHLEMRVWYKQTHSVELDEAKLSASEGYSTQDLLAQPLTRRRYE